MEHMFFAIPISGGIGIALFPKQAREVYVALSAFAWVRKLAEDCSDLAYRVLERLEKVFSDAYFAPCRRIIEVKAQRFQYVARRH